MTVNIKDKQKQIMTNSPDHPLVLSAAGWPVQTLLSFPFPTWPDTGCPCQGLLGEYTHVGLKIKQMVIISE